MPTVRAVALSLCAALLGCAGPLTMEQRGRINTIGVISLLGDRVTLSYTGMLDGSRDKIPVPDAQFDTLAEDAVIECGKTDDRPRVFKKIAISKQPLMDKLYSGVLALYNATMSEARPELSAWIKQNPVDAIVIVRELNLEVPARGPSQYFAGLGLHQLSSYAPIVQGAFGIDIWDSNLQEIASFASMPASGDYPEPIKTVRSELAAGQRIPLIPILQAFVWTNVCRMVRRAKL